MYLWATQQNKKVGYVMEVLYAIIDLRGHFFHVPHIFNADLILHMYVLLFIQIFLIIK
jgi:hypothetical protein